MTKRFTKFIEQVARERPLAGSYFGRAPAMHWDAWRVVRLLNRELDTWTTGPPDRILDVGCGIGIYEKDLSSRWPKAHVLGMDLSRINLRQAAEYAGKADFLCCDAEWMPLADQSLDLVIAIEVLEHFVDPDWVVRECFRVLRPGGMLVVVVPLAPPLPFLDTISALATRFIGSKMVTDGEFLEHMRIYTKRSLLAAFAEGWSVKKLIPFNLMTFVVALAAKLPGDPARRMTERGQRLLDRIDIAAGRIIYAKAMLILERKDGQ